MNEVDCGLEAIGLINIFVIVLLVKIVRESLKVIWRRAKLIVKMWLLK
tara:strand:+ start:35026 stop:35169 length:144 start_codon:yes stop_codon:yes gene_type:complete